MHRVKKYLAVALCLGAPMLLMANGSCQDNGSSADSQREQAVKTRAQVFAQAQDLVPTPQPHNFPLRKALAEFTVRQDMPNHPWYTYLLGLNGNPVAYYVGKTVPINACDFLSSTQDLHESDHGSYAITTAPSLDGIYYGGSGSSSGCDAWFFFDYSSDALIQIRGINFVTADKPLDVQAQRIGAK